MLFRRFVRSCDCEPQSHINSISRQTATDRRTDRGRVHLASEAGGDGVQHVTLTTAMKKNTTTAVTVRSEEGTPLGGSAPPHHAPSRGAAKGFRHRSANGNCGICVDLTGDAPSSSGTPPTGVMHFALSISIHLFRTLPTSPPPNKEDGGGDGGGA